MRIFTIGHSNQTAESLVSALHAHGIALVLDVRRFAGSRRHPQFSGAALEETLRDSGIGYLHLPALGGRRTPRKDSPNTAWRHPSFRGYADHMATDEYQDALRRLLQEGSGRPTAIMCAEKLWWQCHRGLIADDLKAAGHEVVHILSAERSEPHTYTSAARIVDGRLSYEGLLP